MANNYKIRRFNGEIDAWVKSVEAGLNDVAEIFAERVHTELVNRSPVDTGRFRGNWQVTANDIPLYALDRTDKTGIETIAEGKRAIYAMLHGGGAVRSIHFSNMLIYANALEYGHSKQAPNGVVGIVAARLGIIFKDAVRESKVRNAL